MAFHVFFEVLADTVWYVMEINLFNANDNLTVPKRD
jgi:dolichol kinase